MPAARYWRVVGVETYAGGDLEVAELHLYSAAGRADGAGVLTSTIAPVAGSLAALQDDNLSTVCRFAAASVRSSGFALVWDFGTGGAADVIGVRPASAGRSTFLAACDLQYSADGVRWELLSRFSRYDYPGDAAYALPPSLSDPVFGSVELLLQFDGTNGSTNIIDSGPKTRAVTVSGSAKISTAQSKWGGGSLLLSGLDSDVFITSPLGSNSPFCMEAWVRLNATDAGGQYSHPIFGQGGNVGDSDHYFGLIYGDQPNPLRLRYYRGSGIAAKLDLVGSTAAPRQEWVHCALDYDGATIRGFLNGVQQFSQVSATGWVPTAYPFRVGRCLVVNYVQYRQGFQGCIGEVRITPSSRYTASFTPPIQRFPTSPSGGTVYVPPLVRAKSPSAVAVAGSAVVPAHSSRRAAGLQMARDVEFGGNGRLWGTTKTEISPGVFVPTKARVSVLRQRDMQLARQIWSDPATGAWEVRGLDTSQTFLEVAQHVTGEKQAVAADQTVPVEVD